jgi:hypothetical protein
MVNQCIPFWMDDPIEAITNLRSILPRANQCINEKLNSLSFFSVLFSLFLWVMKVPYAWAFGIFGLLAAVLLKLVFFDKDNGEMTYEQYFKLKSMKDLSKYLPNEGDDEFQNLSDTDVHFISTSPHRMEGITKDSTFEEMKDSVTDDLWKARIPMVVPLSYTYGDICVV